MELSDVFQPWANKINAHVHVIWLNCHHLALRSPFCTYVSIPHRGLEHTRIFRTFTSSTWMKKKESNDYSSKEWTSLSTLCVYMERDLTISPHWIRKLPVWQTRKSNINEGSPLCSTADLGGKKGLTCCLISGRRNVFHVEQGSWNSPRLLLPWERNALFPDAWVLASSGYLMTYSRDWVVIAHSYKSDLSLTHKSRG